MRDKVDHMREEVNIVSRHCYRFAIELLIPTTAERILKKENSCPISKQHNAPRHLRRGL
jgi:hypothetical protein